MTNLRVVIAGLLLLGGALLLTESCGRRAPLPGRLGVRRGSAGDVGSQKSEALIKAIARGLNNLPQEVALELQPPFPVLDDSKSADRQEVLATCSTTPGVLGSPYNYLEVPKGNANFRTLKVRPGDRVRYFVTYTDEDPEYGVQQLTHLELVVRRLDTSNNPQNALIVERGLNGPVTIPSRIEIWRFSDKRMKEINLRLRRYIQKPRRMQGWEPSPDESALTLLHDRLNQWLRNVPPSTAATSGRSAEQGMSHWEPDPLVSGLPEALRESDHLRTSLTPAGQRSGLFETIDGRLLQQAFWLRDISSWAKGSGLTDLEVAEALFDWTIRNIQLDGGVRPGIVHQPWQALLYGRGTAAQRAWVFGELCRQQQLDVVMLAIGPSDNAPLRDWLPALWSGGKLYLFDAWLGFPVPGKEAGTVATLAELRAEPVLLRRLDLDAERLYPVTADDLKRVEAHLIASPLQLSRRAALLEQKLDGNDYAVLSADNSRIAAELDSHPHIANLGLWRVPHQAVLDEYAMTESQREEAAMVFLGFVQRPRLWKARVLHFQGTKEIPADQLDDPLSEEDLGHDKAKSLYLDPRVRPPASILEKVAPGKQALYRRVKGDASYWLGLLCYDLGDYEVAVDWLKEWTLDADPRGPWTAGARYNLSRAYEALGRIDEAMDLLTTGVTPQNYGDQIRARQLQKQTEKGEQ
ncbi:MAG: tetratricopeptide repeat protein [Pirellulales bacterium]|nr:tetratricopeptide repeat protein [Pirellulales bacterium]